MEAVQRGMDIARESGKPFQWLTSTNKGAAEVCRAALRSLQVTEEELKSGYSCDPASKSDLRIVAKKGLLIRLTRNLDKQRGFVNGAVAEVWEALEGNSVFIAKLVGSGNLVLVHPMWEDGVKFLPCCYGCATTDTACSGGVLGSGLHLLRSEVSCGWAWIRPCGCEQVQVSCRGAYLREGAED